MANLLSLQFSASVRHTGRLVSPKAASLTQRRYKQDSSAEYLHKSIVPSMHYQKSLPR